MAQLKKCAKGDKPLRLEVAIGDFHQSNAAKAYLIGDANRIRGVAKLVDPATGAVVGDYDINRSVGGGGLIGAIGMSDAAGQMADAFAGEVCKQAFIAR